MATGVENLRHFQYASDLIGSLDISTHHATYFPSEVSGPVPILSDLRETALHAALLGHLEGSPQSLAMIFKMQDRAGKAIGKETPSITERLDLCILASICAGLDHLGAYSMAEARTTHPPNHLYWEQISGGAPLEQRIGYDTNRIASAALYLTKAKYLLYHVFEARNSKVSDAIIDLFVKELGEKNCEKNNDHRKQSINKQWLMRDEIYGYIVLGLIRSAREGDIEGDTSDCGGMESVVQFMRSEDVHPEIHPHLIARFMSYAYMNKARKELEAEAYRNTYAEPTSSQHLTPVMCCIARANGFINAILPFLIDLTDLLPGV